MSKPVKSLMTESYRRRFDQLDGAVVVNISGVTSNNVNRLRSDLSRHNIRLTVVKNTLAKKAVSGTAMQGLSELLDGPCTVVYGGESAVVIARELIGLAKQIEHLSFKGALMEGQVFAEDQVEALSKYPTRQEAQAQLVQVVLSPGRNLAGQVLGPGGKLAALVKAIQEKLENGETIKAA